MRIGCDGKKQLAKDSDTVFSRFDLAFARCDNQAEFEQ
ncbi:hypothetical protein SynA1560_00917 [Synechococcus sp. A15-60]|nr:hypothetical protein SynA1560_00917 [Synechococcus sp. A15-60]